MTDQFRAMCAELADVVYEYCILHEGRDHLQPLVDRARALLAQPVAKRPTDDELLASVRHFYGDQTAADMGAKDDLRTARAVLARWGHPTPQPMADGEVAELCAWLRNNSSGIYRPAARAADLLERLESDNVGLAAAADSLWADNVSLLDN